MNPLVTVLVNPDGSTRLSRITNHGEEVVVANREVRSIALVLWSRLAQGTLSHATLEPNVHEHLCRLAEPLATLEQSLQRLASLEARLTAIETEQARLTRSIKAAVERLTAQPVPSTPPARGQ